MTTTRFALGLAAFVVTGWTTNYCRAQSAMHTIALTLRTDSADDATGIASNTNFAPAP